MEEREDKKRFGPGPITLSLAVMPPKFGRRDDGIAKFARGYMHKRAEDETGIKRHPGPQQTKLAVAMVKAASLEKQRTPRPAQPMVKPAALSVVQW